MLDNAIVFETNRLSIRKYSVSDALALFNILQEKDITNYIPENAISAEGALNAVKWLISNYQNPTTDYFKYSFAISLKENGNYIGWCGFGVLDFDISQIEVYYTISRTFWGKGFASEATKGLIRYIFDNYDIGKLVALVKTENIASQKIIKKNGFQFHKVVSGLSENYEFYNGELYYELKRDAVRY
jgi:[ribosomal protein S5]-alanine N-acetyltransferase